MLRTCEQGVSSSAFCARRGRPKSFPQARDMRGKRWPLRKFSCCPVQLETSTVEAVVDVVLMAFGPDDGEC